MAHSLQVCCQILRFGGHLERGLFDHLEAGEFLFHSLSPVNVKNLGTDGNRLLTDAEKSLLRGLLGSLQWTATQAAPWLAAGHQAPAADYYSVIVNILESKGNIHSSLEIID